MIFFIDNQSVCCAFAKGCSRSWDICAMAATWHLLSLKMGCRIWIEYVRSADNPADILSREATSLYPTTSGRIDSLILPAWVNMAGKRNIKEILERV